MLGADTSLHLGLVHYHGVHVQRQHEPYPGRDFSTSQLLYATKKKLQGDTLDGRYAYQSVPMTLMFTQAQILQDRDDSRPGRGEEP